MKKTLPLIILLVMGLMLMVSWSNISSAKTDVVERYKTMLQQGERYEEKKIYSDAVREYESALKLKPDYHLALRVADLYQKMDDDNGYLKTLDTAIHCDPLNPEPYMMKITYYHDACESEELYHALNNAKQALQDSDRYTEEQRQMVNGYLKELLSIIETFEFDYDEFDGFHKYEGKGRAYSRVMRDGKYGIIDQELNNTMPTEYDEISLAGGGYYPILKDGEYYYCNSAGERRLVPDDPATGLGVFGAGLAPIQVNGKYGYMDTNMGASHFDYDFAGSFENGIAPVKQNGKWFVINKQFQPIGPNFDEILVDNYGFCSPYGVYFGKSGNSWGMYSTAGEKIADGFEDVKQFASNQPTAFKKSGKWGFVSLSGEEILAPQFEDANSFSIDYAPVLKNGLWGCINQDGEMIVDPQFKALGSFTDDGYAIGENAEGLCTVVIRQYK